MKKKPAHLHCEIYGQRIYIFYKWGSRQFTNHVKKIYKWKKEDEIAKDDVGGCWQMASDDGQDDFIVWVHKDSEHPTDVLAHEITHLKNMIFKHVGHVLDAGNDEHEAYYVQKLHKFVRENCD
jgi:hypothetical protein